MYYPFLQYLRLFADWPSSTLITDGWCRYFLTDVINLPDISNLKKTELFWLIVAEGYSLSKQGNTAAVREDMLRGSRRLASHIQSTIRKQRMIEYSLMLDFTQ